MDMSFNWAIDHVLEDVTSCPTIRYDERLSPWIIAEIQADLMEELGRRLDTAGSRVASL
jgi:hypothetical protein